MFRSLLVTRNAAFQVAFVSSKPSILLKPALFRPFSTLKSPASLTPTTLIKVLDEISTNMSHEPTIKELEDTAKTIPNDAKRQQFVFDEVVKIQHDMWVKHGLDPKLGFELLHSEEGWDQVNNQDVDDATKQQLVQRLMEFDTLEEKLVMTAAHGEEEYKNQFERRLIIQEIFADLNKLDTEEEKLEMLDKAIAEAQQLFKEKLGGFTEEEIEQKFESVLSFDEQRLIMRGQLCREIQDSAEEEGGGHGHSHNGVACHGHHHHDEEEHGHSHNGVPCSGHHEEEDEVKVVRDETGKPVWKKPNNDI